MNIVFDFDSTLIDVESLDFAISKISGGKFSKQIEDITNQGMDGIIDLEQSISRRLDICQITQKDIQKTSFVNNITYGLESIIYSLQKDGHTIYIVSGGIVDFILPVAKILDIPPQNCMANEIIFHSNGTLDSLNNTSPLLFKDGKSIALEMLGILNDKTIMVGDGYTDLEVNINNPQVHFIGFGLNIVRESVQKKAKYFVTTIDGLRDVLKQILRPSK
ncbi:MAG: phosphoserine phosphatase [Candidatus Deianiraeaceae bacterium]|jgi:phosphoserine phosphatase